jgi:2,3,4,5-tetrahydropyridine-2,6-dicarboxylate N-succinyltransferase
VIVEEGSVISMGVYIGQSTKIYNRETGEVSYGRMPKPARWWSPATCPPPDGKYSAVLRRDREAGRREDPLQGRHQRTFKRYLTKNST